jgi:hypothetical protein
MSGAKPGVFHSVLGMSGRCTLCSTTKKVASKTAPTMIRMYVYGDQCATVLLMSVSISMEVCSDSHKTGVTYPCVKPKRRHTHPLVAKRAPFQSKSRIVGASDPAISATGRRGGMVK